MQISCFIPTIGDGRYLGSSHQSRIRDYVYLRQIAQAVDDLGFHAVLLPTGNSCEDAWVVASTLVPSTRRLKFLVAIRPGIMTPTLAARMTATFDRLSGGRLLINVVTGGDPQEAAAEGVFFSHDERYLISKRLTGLLSFCSHCCPLFLTRRVRRGKAHILLKALWATSFDRSAEINIRDEKYAAGLHPSTQS